MPAGSMFAAKNVKGAKSENIIIMLSQFDFDSFESAAPESIANGAAARIVKRIAHMASGSVIMSHARKSDLSMIGLSDFNMNAKPIMPKGRTNEYWNKAFMGVSLATSVMPIVAE